MVNVSQALVTNTINNEVTTYKSTSSQINVNGLTAGVQYLVVIAGIDKGEREGENGYLTFEIGEIKYIYSRTLLFWTHLWDKHKCPDYRSILISVSVNLYYKAH